MGLGAFIAGLGSGYLRGQQQQLENERQAKRDAMLEEQFQWSREQAAEQRREREGKAAERKILQDGAEAGTVENNVAAVTYTDPNGVQKTAYQPDQDAAAFAAEQQRLEEGSAPTAPAVQSNPEVTSASSVRTLDGGRKLFTGLDAAIQAKRFTDENPSTPYAKFMAMSDRVMKATGNQELADKLIERAKKAEKEGAFQTLNLLEAGDTQGALKAWNGTGAARMQPGQSFKTIVDSAGRKIHQVVNEDGSIAVKNVESALLNYIGGIEGVASRAAARDKAAIDRQGELLKPRTLRPGERLIVPGEKGFETVAENPTDRVQIGEDEDGNPIYGKPSKYLRGQGQGGVGGDGADGDGTKGSKKKGKTDIDIATSSVMDAIKESAESKTLNADQLIGVQATARELVSNAARTGQQLDPYVAGKVALTAVLKPESVRPAYNPNTGTFENTVAYNGNTFSVGRVDPTTMPDSQLKGVAQSFVSKLPTASRAEYVKAASGDQAAIDKINADIVAAHGKSWVDSFRASTGRAPTQQDIQNSIARTQAVVGQNIDLVRRSGVVEQTKKTEEKAAADKVRADAKAAIGTPDQIMALPRGEAARIYQQYNQYTDARQREALQMKMAQDRRMNPVGGLRQQ